MSILSMNEYKIDLETAENYLDKFEGFPEVINHFGIAERPINIIKTRQLGMYSIGETIDFVDDEETIEYFGVIDFDASSYGEGYERGTTVIVCNRSGFAPVSKIKKL